MHFSCDDCAGSVIPFHTVRSKEPGHRKCSETLAVTITDTRRATRGRPGHEARRDGSAIPGPRPCMWHLGADPSNTLVNERRGTAHPQNSDCPLSDGYDDTTLFVPAVVYLILVYVSLRKANTAHCNCQMRQL